MDKKFSYGTRVGELGIDRTTISALHANGIRYVGEIQSAFNNGTINRLKGVNAQKVEEIRGALAFYGVKIEITPFERLLADIELNESHRLARARLFMDEPFDEKHIDLAYKYLMSSCPDYWPTICEAYGLVTSKDHSAIECPYYKSLTSSAVIAKKHGISKTEAERRISSGLINLRRTEVHNTIVILYDSDEEIIKKTTEAQRYLDGIKRLDKIKK